jgi:hypothetical protein
MPSVGTGEGEPLAEAPETVLSQLKLVPSCVKQERGLEREGAIALIIDHDLCPLGTSER